MADVQKENGFTPIANAILENMATIKLSPTQYRIIFVIWRYTYGFNRKSYEFSLTFLANATGCDKRQIQRELKDLESRKIIFQSIKNRGGRTIEFNKDYEQWIGRITIGGAVIGETTDGEITNGETTNGETVKRSIGETTNMPIGETTNQKRKYKDNIKDKEDDEDDIGVPSPETTNPDKVPSHCQEDDPVLTFLNQVSSYYTSLTGRFASPSDEVAITEIAKHTTDFQLVKEAMDMTFKNYKPRYKGDKIRAFRYFVPAILERLAVEEEKRKLKEAGVKVANGDDNVLGEKTSRASGFDKSKFLYQGGG